MIPQYAILIFFISKIRTNEDCEIDFQDVKLRQ